MSTGTTYWTETEYDDFAGDIGDNPKQGNLDETKGNIDELQGCVEDVRETVEDIREALGVFRAVQRDAAAAGRIIDSLEKIATLAAKIPPLKRGAEPLSDLLAGLGDTVDKIEKEAKRIADRVEPVRDRLADFRDGLEKVEDKLGQTSDAVGEVRDTAVSVQYVLEGIREMAVDPELTDANGNPLVDAELANDIEKCLSVAVAPANGAMEAANTEYDKIKNASAPLPVLLDLFDGVNLGPLEDILDFRSDLGDVLDYLSVLEKPLLELEKVITSEVEAALDASNFIYNSVAAPVVDPVLKSLGIDTLIQTVIDSIQGVVEDSLNVDVLDGAADFVSDLEVEIPKVGANLETGTIDALEMGAFFDEFNLDRPAIDGSLTLPFNAGIYDLPTLANKGGYWTSAGERGLELTSDPDTGGVLIGSSGNDTLTRLGNDLTDILVGGAGNDTFERDRFWNNEPYDVFIGGAGNDNFDARGNVIIAYEGLISDYRFERIGTGQLTIEHLNPRGGLDEGTDTVEFNPNRDAPILSFDGYRISLLTFVNGLYNTSDRNSPDFDGTNGRDFVFGDGRENELKGGLEDDLLVGRNGDDILRGNDGNDYLDGGRGQDEYYGGQGIDTADFRSEDALSVFFTGVNLFLGEEAFKSNGNRSDDMVELGFYPSDRVQGVEFVIGLDGEITTGRGDKIFGYLDASETIQGRGGDDLIRSSGGFGSLLDGGAGDDQIIADSGSDTVVAGAGQDVAYGVLLANASGSGVPQFGMGNHFDGGSGAAEEFDTLTYAWQVTEVRSTAFVPLSIDTQESRSDHNPAFGTANDKFKPIDLSTTMTGGHVEIDVADRTVTRVVGSDRTVDTFENFEVLVGSDGNDTIWVDGTDDDVTHISGFDGEDVFHAGPSDAVAGSTDYTTVGPRLYGGNGSDTFILTSLFDVDGDRAGNGDRAASIDTVDLSQAKDVQWYLKGSRLSAFDEATDRDGNLLQPALTQIFGDPEDPDALGFGRDGVYAPALDYNTIGENDFVAAVLLDVERIIGGAGDDVLLGSRWTELRGGAGDDFIAHNYMASTRATSSNEYAEALDGGDGSDIIVAAQLRNLHMMGGAGEDVLDLTSGGQFWTIEGGFGNDLFLMRSTVSGSAIYGGAWAGTGAGTLGNFHDDEQVEETRIIGDGEDAVEVRYTDTVQWVEDGPNVSEYSTKVTSLVVDLQDSSLNDGGARNVAFYGIENFFATLGDDTLYGTEDDNVLFGASGISGGGADTIYGRGGNDIIGGGGGPGGNALYGGEGDDTFFVVSLDEQRAGADTVDGGANTAFTDSPYVADADGQLQLVGDMISFAPDIPQARGTLDIDASRTGRVTLDLGAGTALVQDINGLPLSTRSFVITGIEHVTGGAKDDNLSGDSNSNVILGGNGNDIISGGSGKDILGGDAGNDELFGNRGDDTFLGSIGTDLLVGGQGSGDTADFSTNTLGVIVRIGNGGEHTLSTVSSDSGEYDGTITGLWRTDTGDIVSDVSYVRNIEVFVGSIGDDTFFATAGADDFDAGGGFDALDFEDSADGINFSLATGATTSSGGFAANSTYTNFEALFGTTAADRLEGDESDNFLAGRGGDDEIIGNGGDDILEGGGGGDTLEGGAGSDTARYTGSAVTLDLQANLFSGGDAEGDALNSIENLHGTEQADELAGDAQKNVLTGGGGDDSLYGRAGDDKLVLSDFTEAFATGGDGDDTLILTGDAAVALDLSDSTQQNIGSARRLTVKEVENLTTGGGADDILGSSLANILDLGDGDDKASGGQGNDIIVGGNGTDDLRGNRGDDTIDGGAGDDLLRGDRGNDKLIGGDGNDTLLGKEGDDLLDGGDGDDYLNGGSGVDELTGGLGGDIFAIDLSEAVLVTITDFEVATSLDGEQVDEIVLARGDRENLVYTDVDDDNDGTVDYVEITSSEAGLTGKIHVLDARRADFIADENRQSAGNDGNLAPEMTDQSVTVSESQGSASVDLTTLSNDADGNDLAYRLVVPSASLALFAAPTASAATSVAPNAAEAAFVIPGFPLPPISIDPFALFGDKISIEDGVLQVAFGEALGFLTGGVQASFTLSVFAQDFFGATSEAAEIEVIIVGENTAPEAAGAVLLMDEDEKLEGSVSGLVFDPDTLTSLLAYSVEKDPEHGTLTFQSNGSFNYQPDADFAGKDSFIYAVVDNTGGRDTAIVTIDVAGSNDAPVGQDDVYSMIAGSVLTISSDGVLANDSDVDGDALSARLAAGPTKGNLTLNADGSFEYAPASGFSGVDSFTYFVEDGDSAAANANTVTITVETAPNNVIAEDDTRSISIDALNEAGAGWLRIGAVENQTNLLANDIAATSITEINASPLKFGEWFEGDNGGQFRVFGSGVVDFRNQGVQVVEGDQTGFRYAASGGAVPDTASVVLTIGAATGLAEDDTYAVSTGALDYQNNSWFRLGAHVHKNTLLENDTATAKIFSVNGQSLFPEGEWFDGDNGGQFRVFAGGVFDFRNQGQDVSEYDTTGFSYTIFENGALDTARVSLTIVPDPGPAQDDRFLVSADDFDKAGNAFIRLAALEDGFGLLINDDMVDEILFVNDKELAAGEWFAGSDGGEFRLFAGGVLDFRNTSGDFEANEQTGFVYGTLKDGLYDTAEVILNGALFDLA